MKINPDFIGRNYLEEEKDFLRSKIDTWSNEASVPLEGELEKTKEELGIIGTVNFLIQAELESLGIEYTPMPPEKIHLLSGEVFKKHFPGFTGIAFFSSGRDQVCVNKEKSNTNTHLLVDLIHELIHRASAIRFYSDVSGGIYSARTGYHLRAPWKDTSDKIQRKNRLEGFNELINDFTVYKIILDNKELLEEAFGITEEEIHGPIFTYMQYVPILESIVDKVAEYRNIDPGEVFHDLESGQFKNNILALKYVDKSFGKGALEVLSLLRSIENKEKCQELDKMIMDFFLEKDESKREHLRVDILEFAKNAESNEETKS